ncbi:hypothetical protein ACHAPA_012314 [Fusarium lateritium]
MPMLWDEDHLKLINTYLRSESLYELYLQLPRLANNLKNNQTLKDNKFKVVDTINSLQNYNWSICELLHSISPKVVKSIVQNTVAYNSIQQTISGFEVPSKKDSEEIPSIYIIGISLLGKNGYFLNIREIELLIEHIEAYIKGYHAHLKLRKHLAEKGRASAKTYLSVEEDKAYRIMKRINGKSRGEPTDLPIFITKDEEVPRIQALVETYKAICDLELDPTKRIQMIQSPLYVGCSKNLAERTKRYTQSSLKGINKPLGITLTILRTLKIPFDLQIKTVILYQHGFNTTEARGTGFKTVTSMESLKANTTYIFFRMAHLLTNLKNSLEEVNIRTRFLDDIDIIEGQVVNIRDTLKQYEDKLARLPPNFQWDNTLSDIEQLIQDLKKDLEDKQEALRF